MIKIFRNIRRRLLRENRFTRYLIYAMGEITLVVIGILIALQINNWNQERLHKKEEIKQVKLMLQDANQDSILFATIKQSLKESDTLQKNFLALYDPELRDSVAKLKSPNRSAFGSFLPYESNVIINSRGAFDIIENDSIKKQVRELNSSYAILATSLDIYNRHVENHFTPLYMEHSDSFSVSDTVDKNLMAAYLPMIRNEKFEAYIRLSRSWGKNALARIEKFNEQLEELRSLLESYLEDNSYD
jgi:uncharacterized membrane-anchored protein YhcB (DUF1043 family)